MNRQSTLWRCLHIFLHSNELSLYYSEPLRHQDMGSQTNKKENKNKKTMQLHLVFLCKM